MPQAPAKNIAFLVGISQYQFITPLTTPESDVTALATLLSEDFGYRTVIRLQQDAAAMRAFFSAENLTRHIREQLGNATNDSSVMVYFAGHGYAEESESGVNGYLIPADGRRGDRHSWFDMTELLTALDELPCRHLLLVLDCCFGGSVRWASRYRDVMFAGEKFFKSHYNYYTSRRSWQALTSTAPNQSALDLIGHGEKQGHSPFAYCLLEALKGQADTNKDKVITTAELYAWLQNRVTIITTELGNVQNVGLFPLEKHDQGEYLFLLDGFDPKQLTESDMSNPYRGLESYNSDNRNLFFGRSDAITELQNLVQDQPLVIVVGASGTGKSSLVKAGIVPRLQKVVKIITPGRKPIEELHQAGEFEVLVIDQFEHLVTQAEHGEAELFLQEMAELLKAGKRIILTVRIDYENQLPILDSLKDPWKTGRYLVPTFSAEELREVIITPALRVGRFIEPPGLVDKIVSEVIHFPGSLPLLSFTMRELFEKSKKRVGAWYSIQEADYDALGGVIGALQNRADSVFEDPLGLTPFSQDLQTNKKSSLQTDQRSMRNLLLRMVSLTGGETSGQRVIKEELKFEDPQETLRTNDIVSRLLNERLLRSDTDSEGKDFIEPAHDALVRTWKKMQQWISEFKEENILLADKLRIAVRDYELNLNSKDYLWYETPNLEPLEKAQVSADIGFKPNQSESAFLKESRRVKNLNRRNRISQVMIAFVLLSALTVFGFVKATQATNNALEAKKQEDKALLEADSANVARLRADSLNKVAQSALAQRIIAEENRRQEQIKTFKAQGNDFRGRKEYDAALQSYRNAFQIAVGTEKNAIQATIDSCEADRKNYNYDNIRRTGLNLVDAREFKAAEKYLREALLIKSDDPPAQEALKKCVENN